MNPNQKPAAGSYRSIIVAALIAIGRTAIADMFENKTLNFGVVATFTGNVKRLPELQNDIISLLEKQDNDIARYYLYELKAGNVAVVSSDGAFVYKQGDIAAEAFVKEQIAKSDAEVFKSGELYFKS